MSPEKKLRLMKIGAVLLILVVLLGLYMHFTLKRLFRAASEDSTVGAILLPFHLIVVTKSDKSMNPNQQGALNLFATEEQLTQVKREVLTWRAGLEIAEAEEALNHDPWLPAVPSKNVDAWGNPFCLVPHAQGFVIVSTAGKPLPCSFDTMRSPTELVNRRLVRLENGALALLWRLETSSKRFKGSPR